MFALWIASFLLYIQNLKKPHSRFDNDITIDGDILNILRAFLSHCFTSSDISYCHCHCPHQHHWKPEIRELDTIQKDCIYSTAFSNSIKEETTTLDDYDDYDGDSIAFIACVKLKKKMQWKYSCVKIPNSIEFHERRKCSIKGNLITIPVKEWVNYAEEAEKTMNEWKWIQIAKISYGNSLTLPLKKTHKELLIVWV